MKFAQNRILDFLGGGICTAGTLTLLVSGLPFLQGFLWFLEIPGHFRMQLGLCLLIAALAMALYRMWIPAGLFLLVGIANASVLFPLYLQAPGGEGEAGETFTMVLFNVNSSSGRPEAVRTYLEEEAFDLVILQEYSRRWEQEMSHLSYAHRLEAVREDNFGMAVFSRFPFTASDVVYLTEEPIPSLRVELEVNGHVLHLLASHPLPPVNADYTAARDEQLRVLSDSRTEKGPMILAGDFNTTPWSAEVQQILEKTDLKNSANGFGYQPTWPSMLPPLWTILDHVFYDGLHLKDRSIGPALGSDHYPIKVTFAFPL
jgi:endonuclease/exonuclease/phosphatase (EEP) superfamily protein YafD